MNNDSPRTALVMAGGTGGHIFPGLAVAEALRQRGWRVHWLGAPDSMEARLVPPRGFTLETINFGGVRGKGLLTLPLLPLRLLRAFWQSVRVLRRVRPQVAIGLGGYITFPGGMMASLLGVPLILHEQNSVAGMANKVLAGVADRVFVAFPGALKKSHWVGNPLREGFLNVTEPPQRFAARSGPLRLLVVGGSLGAKALNDLVPQALALMPAEQRPQVIHQSGERQLDALRGAYAAAQVEATLVPFIEEMAVALADCDAVICRAGASTVSEVAAVGAAALFVPFPFAVDDHQSVNARFLVEQGGAWLVEQRDLSAERLAQMIRGWTREELARVAGKARQQARYDATERVVAACEALGTR